MKNMLMMKRTILTCLPALLLSAACTKTAETVDPYQSDDTARVKVTLGLEGMAQTRAGDDSRLDDDAYKKQSRISDGTRATTLIYALYDANGEALKIKDPGSGKLMKQVVREGVRFPFSENLEFNLVKGLEYTLVFWAQSPEGDHYYDTRDLKNIIVKYDDPWQQNNDEARDAFCVSRRLTITQDELNLQVVLRRPFAQINIGFPKGEYATWTTTTNGTEIRKSSISISGAGNRFDLVADKVLGTDAKISFGLGTIPHLQEDFGCPDLEIDLDRNAGINEGEQFIWASMCYILVPNYRDETDAEDDADNTFMYSTLIDIPEICFLDSDGERKVLTPENSDLTNIPVQNNHRTNIIFKDLFGYDVRILVDIDSRYAGDQPNEE